MKYVIMLDGGFVKKKLQAKNGHFPTVAETVALTALIRSDGRLSSDDLLRIYYYDAPPYQGKAKHNPIDGTLTPLANSPWAQMNRSLLDSLEMQEDFAVRRGVVIQKGWKLGPQAMGALGQLPSASSATIQASDLLPDLEQKGVDLRIGLDVATIALKGVVDTIVLVTGDSDFVPAMKLARKEGLRIYLKTMGHPVRRELKAHADYVF